MKQAPAGCDQCQRYPARQFPDTIAATGMALIAACGLINTRRRMRRDPPA